MHQNKNVRTGWWTMFQDGWMLWLWAVPARGFSKHAQIKCSFGQFHVFLLRWWWCRRSKPTQKAGVAQFRLDLSRQSEWINYLNYHLLKNGVKVSYAKRRTLSNSWRKLEKSHCCLLHLPAVFRAPCGLSDAVWFWINLYFPQSSQEPLMIWHWERRRASAVKNQWNRWVASVSDPRFTSDHHRSAHTPTHRIRWCKKEGERHSSQISLPVVSTVTYLLQTPSEKQKTAPDVAH